MNGFIAVFFMPLPAQLGKDVKVIWDFQCLTKK